MEVASYKGANGTITAHVAKPEGKGPFPAVVLSQEIFGISDFMLDSARLIARQGYLAIVPNLYTNDPVRDLLTIPDMENAIKCAFSPDPTAAMNQIPADERPMAQQALAWLQGIMANPDYVPDTIAAVNYAKTRSDVRSDDVALVGFCMGGGIVGQALVQNAPVKAAVILYGQLPEPSQAASIKVPLQGHFGGEDPFVTGALPHFAKAMESARKSFESHVYEGAEHAFCNYSRQSFHPVAAALAWKRTFEFLAKYLKA